MRGNKRNKTTRFRGYCACGGEFRMACDIRALTEADLFALGIGPRSIVCESCFAVQEAIK